MNILQKTNKHSRYTSCLTDLEWSRLEALLLEYLAEKKQKHPFWK